MYVRLIKGSALFAAVHWVGPVEHRSILAKSLFSILFTPKLFCSMLASVDDDNACLECCILICNMQAVPPKLIIVTRTLQAEEEIQIH